MSTITIQLTGPGSCIATHVESGAVVKTAAPPEYGGPGGSFSATDLLAAALGVCIATSIDQVALRHGIPLSALDLHVRKTLATDPKRISALAVTIDVHAPLDDAVKLRLERAAATCVVHRALGEGVSVDVVVQERR